MSSLTKKKKNIKAIYIGKDTKAVEFKLPYDVVLDKLDINKFPSCCKNNIGKSSLSRECDFEYDDKVISVFAYTEGKESQINNIELPPPIDNIHYYGNIFIISHKDDKLLDLTKDEFEVFYSHSFGGFEDLGEDDSWSSEPDSPTQSDKDFIAPEGSVSCESDEEDGEEEDEDEEDEDEEEYSAETDDNNSPISNNSISDLSNSIDEQDSVINLKEASIIDEYLINLDKRFLKAPDLIKEYVYKFHDKNETFLYEWFNYKIKNDNKKLYSEYMNIYKNLN